MLRFLFFFWLIFGPIVFFLFNHSMDDVVEELITASQKNSVQGIADRIDWEETRVFLKENLTATKGALGSYGAVIGPDKSKIPAIIDHYIQPENIEVAYYFHDTLFPDVKEEDFIRSVSYEPPIGFQVTLGYPLNLTVNPKVTPMLKDQLKVKFVFRLDGLTWKIQEMHVPIYMVPRQIHNMQAMRQFGEDYAP